MDNIRVKRLRKLISEQFGGSQTALAARAGMSLPQIGQYLNGYRNMGEKTARKIEAACGKPNGWMDRELDDIFAPVNQLKVGENQSTYELSSSDLVEIRKINLKLSAGISGFTFELTEEDGLPLAFRKSWIQKNGYDAEKLIALKVIGNSMEPTLHDGDTVVVNTADTVPVDGVVFAVNYEGEPVIKRLTRDVGTWWLYSDNPDQRKYSRKACDSASIIIGRVIHKQSQHI